MKEKILDYLLGCEIVYYIAFPFIALFIFFSIIFNAIKVKIKFGR